jgi:hypothetical protein
MNVSNAIVTKLVSVSLELAPPTPGISPGTGGGVVCSEVEPPVGTPPITDPPTPGISPANAVPERTHANAIANNSRFIDCLLFELRTM